MHKDGSGRAREGAFGTELRPLAATAVSGAARPIGVEARGGGHGYVRGEARPEPRSSLTLPPAAEGLGPIKAGPD